ncbi:MAG: Gfo/Idh/MocA family oxidoreductase [Cellvibrionaceae bacterium]|nr:Gfo/Idh/MocA family oxidoreductase [Cellvibrionaceae bacterium]
MSKDDTEKPAAGSAASRRAVLKGLVGVPVVAGLGISAAAKQMYENNADNRSNNLNIEASTPPLAGPLDGEPIRLGIVGYGIRGKQLMRALGFAHQSWIDEMEESARTRGDTRLEHFLGQASLNVEIRGVCDVFEVNAQMAIEAGTTSDKNKGKNSPKRYRHYLELIDSPDIDAVVIATPDHWHAPMATAALNAGKHVYVEKPLAHNFTELYKLAESEKRSGKVLQVGHQHRQTQSFLTAQDVIRKNVLGHISLIQANTNRNSDNGAWQYPIHSEANPQTIDWEQFLGPNNEKIAFDKERFFRWRKWWAYGSGISGDLLTHDYDRINCVVGLGIPSSVIASGGIYTHRDGREVPDVFQALLEFPKFESGASQQPGKEQGMAFVYSATLGNQYSRETLIMGHDGTMELGKRLIVKADANSTRYKDWLESGQVDPEVPLYAYNPGSKRVDGYTSPTAKYFADKGLLYTYRNGKRLDSTHLHMWEWLSCIRHGGTTSCGIQAGFEEAIPALMATYSYRTGQKIEFDHATNWLKTNKSMAEIDEILVAPNTDLARSNISLEG